ncbi:MAG: tRNA (adenosine(37)-N6)-threonylcarbamoyltransferase complex dimerization subunit type 1 TsaB [Planctomycetia bacterium]|nr:tRNA (adenosine(37)-N6)-threonylcarbamoyltransferase complex dimerization subunit type 1 TsaB [Planctomycetia bacterium]
MTRILALETSGLSGSVAALDTETSTSIFVALPPTSRSAQSLAPAMAKALAEAGWKPSDVQVVAITSGPGSFTGLRIGVTTAKTFAYVSGADVIAVNTLDVLARQVPGEGTVLWTALDAHRSQFFVNRYSRDAHGGWERNEPAAECALVEVAEWIAQVSQEPTPQETPPHGSSTSGVLVSGPVLEKPGLAFAPHVRLAAHSAWQPRADTVAQLAAELHAGGRRDDLWNLIPYYGRLAAAEEKRNAAGKQ